MVKTLFGVYTIIGLILTPFIYSNNANEYRDGTTGTRIGLALAGGLYWPSYLFSIEPVVNSTSFDQFQKSLIDMVNWRNDKLFTTTRTDEHGNMVITAIGNCAALEGAGNLKDAYKIIFSRNINGNEIEQIRTGLMKKMDGHDFLDLIKAGNKCKQDLLDNQSAATINSTSKQKDPPRPQVQQIPQTTAHGSPKLMGDEIDYSTDEKPNTSDDVKRKISGKSWQDENGFVHYPDGSISSGPVD